MNTSLTDAAPLDKDRLARLGQVQDYSKSKSPTCIKTGKDRGFVYSGTTKQVHISNRFCPPRHHHVAKWEVPR